ncbi:Histone-like protein [Minicystis rosea]|nr:Histone-like protein [Minicystis rosea]
MDAFSAQIVKFVREMPDDALLELVKQKLGVLGAAVGRANGKRKLSPARAVTAAVQKAKGKRSAIREKRRTAPARRAAVSADRQGLLDNIERIVKAGAGVSASDVAKQASIPQTRAAAALKELKLAKRIFQGGDRRFARYAGDAKTAEGASATARKTAKGPVVRGSAKGGRGKKRGAPAQQATAAAA